MNDRSLQKLEFDKITARVAAYCGFSLSRELAERLTPAASAYEAEQLQAETEEARQLIRNFPTFALGGLWDIRPHLRHAEIGGVLEPQQLVNVSDLCRAARQAKSFFSELKGNYPLLTALGKSLIVIKTIETAVEKAIGADMQVNDNASERLAGLRRKGRDKGERIKEKLDGMIRNPATVKFLQEPIVTIREGRFVVPVRQEYRGAVPGVAHDTSASGATVFIEPLAVMELNNELAAIRREEDEEIAAILRALSMVVAGFADELNADLALLARLDFIMAKGQYSYELDGCMPKINRQGRIRLIKARHPLIPAERVVPIDVLLERNIQAMVITGPNTGGKTVTLKTIGLLTAMAMAGLHIPAEYGSELSAFAGIYADIGDEQSIEQSLSTFSSHMSNIVEISAEAKEDCLVLLDELGAGTDPTEGAALAMAILRYLKERGAKIVATTHYSELKAFAYNNEGFINASMEFDIATLSPTYRLQMGIPGKSNAFEISRRLGLDESIIDAAAASLSTEDVAVAAMLAELEDLRRSLSEQQQQLQQREQDMRQREQQLTAARQLAARQHAEAIAAANNEAQRILDETLEKSRALYQQQQQQIAEKKSAERVWQETQKQLKSWREQLEKQRPEPVFAGDAPKKVEAGDYFYLPKLDKYGYALAGEDNGEVLLQVGLIKLRAKLKDIRAAQPREEQGGRKSYGGGKIAVNKAAAVESSLDLHGLETMEALPLLDKYIDDAFIAGLRQVQINHGRGTGALRRFVREYLRGHRLVRSYRDGDNYEGGRGVTIVELDQ
ncbi:MAG: endonuclease MutS2 [Bacillota bacterium]|nr:endonuclease MutS2 [Bacillota bacterium]